MKRRINALIALIMAAVMLCACSTAQAPAEEKAADANASAETAAAKEASEPSQLRVAVTATPPTLDIHTSGAGASLMPGYHIWEQLFAIDDNGNTTAELAESMEANADSTEFVIHLRKGVKFHNGNEMKAEDVVATFDRYKAVGYRGTQVFGDNCKGYEAVDDYTVKVTFASAYPLFEFDLATPLMGPIKIMPKELKDVAANQLSDDQIIGTGPFKFVEYIPDQYLKLAKFEDYTQNTNYSGPTGFTGKREALVDELTFFIVTEKTSRLNGLLTGEYDYAEEVDTSAYYDLESNPDVKPMIAHDVWIPICLTNTMAGPLTDPLVREAILKGIDDDAIMLAASGSKEFYSLNHSPVPVGSYWWTEKGKEYYNQASIEAAKEILAKSSYNGEEVIISTSHEYEWMYQFAVVLQSQLQEIGLNAVIDVVDWATVADRLGKDPENCGYSFSTTGMTIGDVFDPSGLNGLYLTCNNTTKFDNAESRELLEKGMVETNKEKRKEYYDRLQELLISEMGVLDFGYMNTLGGAVQGYDGLDSWFMLRMWNASVK